MSHSLARRFCSTAVALLAVSGLLGIAAPAIAIPDPEPHTTALEPETLADVIAEAAEAGATTAKDFAAAAPVAANGPGSLMIDGAGRISATVFWNGAGDEVPDAIRELVGGDGIEAPLTEVAPAATVRLDPALLTQLRELPGVIGVTPNLRPLTGTVALRDRLDSVRGELPKALAQAGAMPRPATNAPENCRTLPVEADAPLRADRARSEFGVDGTGVTIGIVSDSFSTLTAPTSWADDVAAGALPGPDNPCGRTTPVALVSENADVGADEGRAMAQLVHGIAPGATLLFADDGAGDIGMAANITKLVDAGADIIVDDISWFQEPYFQQGAISAAYERAHEHGVLTVSAAGNSTSTADQGPHRGAPHTSWQTDAYRPMDCPAWLAPSPDDPLHDRTDIDCLDFDPSAAEQAYDLLRMMDIPGRPDHQLTVVASIAKPMYGVTTNYELRFYEEDAAGNPQPFDRITMVGAPYSGAVGVMHVPQGTTLRMVLVRESFDAAVSHTPAVMIGFAMGGAGVAERQFMGNASPLTAQGDRVGPLTLGHNGDGSTLAVAAVEWDRTQMVRPFSSLGPGTLHFEPVVLGNPDPTPAQRLPEPVILHGPHIAGIDGTRTTFFGGQEGTPDAPVYRFIGTSAAAPTVAAVAGLGLSYAPGVPQTELRDALTATARGAADGGPVNPYDPAHFPDSNVFGAGLVDAHALLAALPAPTPPAPPAPPNSGPGAGTDPGTGTNPGTGIGGGDRDDHAAASGKSPGAAPQGHLSHTGGSALPIGLLLLAVLALGTGAMLLARSRRALLRGLSNASEKCPTLTPHGECPSSRPTATRVSATRARCARRSSIQASQGTISAGGGEFDLDACTEG